jgi:hypothetical protein
MFISLTKADAAQRLVWGSFDETPDRAGEVCDYPTAKIAFAAWSEGMSKASEGQNLGNVRAQHDLKKAAGKLVEITFNDAAKSVEFCAKIVDDNEWQKVEQRVYTGFSPGGSYAKRWQDGAYKRYTPVVGELSIVDVPCNPSATFTMVKADGSEETLEFVMAKAYEPGNEATIARADDMWKAAESKGKATDFVAKARAALIVEAADAELAKMAPEIEAPAADAVVPAAPEAIDRAAALDAALAKADAIIAAPKPEAAPVNPEAEALAKGLDDLAAIHAGNPVLAKGLRGIQSLSSAIYQVVAVQAASAREADEEGDNSPVPAQIAEGIKALCDSLCAMAMEETAELLADITAAGCEEAVTDWSVYECGLKIVDLAKADTDLMEKAGARNSKLDAKQIQEIHDVACELGASCADPSAEKVATLSAENERLVKSVDSALPRIEDLAAALAANAEAMTKMSSEIELLKAAPVDTGKGGTFSLGKADDTGLTPATTDGLISLPNGLAKADAILRSVRI